MIEPDRVNLKAGVQLFLLLMLPIGLGACRSSAPSGADRQRTMSVEGSDSGRHACEPTEVVELSWNDFDLPYHFTNADSGTFAFVVVVNVGPSESQTANPPGGWMPAPPPSEVMRHGLAQQGAERSFGLNMRDSDEDLVVVSYTTDADRDSAYCDFLDLGYQVDRARILDAEYGQTTAGGLRDGVAGVAAGVVSVAGIGGWRDGGNQEPVVESARARCSTAWATLTSSSRI